MLLTRRQSDKLLPPHFNFALFSTLYGVYTEFWTHPPEGVGVDVREAVSLAESGQPCRYAVRVHGSAGILGENKTFVLVVFPQGEPFRILPCSLLP